MRTLITGDRQPKGLEAVMAEHAWGMDAAEDVDDFLYMLSCYEYDATMIVEAPGIELGLPIVQEMRKAGSFHPAVVLTRAESPEYRTRVIRSGADDCVPVTAHPGEIAARLQAVARRVRGLAQPMIRVGDLAINIAEKGASLKGQDLALTAREFSVLEVLAMRRGRSVTKDQIISSIYGGLDVPDSKIVDVFICKMRKKMDQIEPGAGRYIATAWGMGFKLDEPKGKPEKAA